jgi:hypothetical protein
VTGATDAARSPWPRVCGGPEHGTRHFIVFHGLGGRDQAGLQGRGALYSFMISWPSSMMPVMASHVLRCGLASMTLSTCSRRETCVSVSPWCFSNAGCSFPSRAAFVIFGSALKDPRSGKKITASGMGCARKNSAGRLCIIGGVED